MGRRWAAGAIAIDRAGFPDSVAVLAFLVGGISAYLIMAATSAPYIEKITPRPVRCATLVNVFAIVATGVASHLVHLVHNAVAAFFTAAFTSTLVYVLSLSTYFWLVTRADTAS
jgi:hypothetical protein